MQINLNYYYYQKPKYQIPSIFSNGRTSFTLSTELTVNFSGFDRLFKYLKHNILKTIKLHTLLLGNVIYKRVYMYNLIYLNEYENFRIFLSKYKGLILTNQRVQFSHDLSLNFVISIFESNKYLQANIM